ncbi:hypothetical protein EH243_03670 [Amphritea opalescens]|uniref:Uncharacterized protein n=1 Tax=Amphritea opalescens TaxID=2490544 RepID=A0A430KUX0_9GAMM|nr:hypothetical protein [Amphritea opalescens]RTE67311.1 hypothetical protein EH243_03670 [Amphritea opalescens]
MDIKNQHLGLFAESTLLTSSLLVSLGLDQSVVLVLSTLVFVLSEKKQREILNLKLPRWV